MSKAALGRKIEINGLTKPGMPEKFQSLVSSKYVVKTIQDKGDYTLLHLRVGIVGELKGDIILYANGTLRISTSPNLGAAKFEEFASSIEKLAKSGAKSVAEEKPLAVTRAADLIEYAKSLDTSHEKQRMVAVIVSDTANEIVLTSKMRALKISGDALKAGVPEKIKYIEDKDEVVYKKENVTQVRELRNDVAHAGNIPTKRQADQVVEWSDDFVKNA